MQICGIIAEYDPLHNGHSWHLEQAKAQSLADLTVCVVSTCFTQRGMPALLSPHVRAEMALRAGADIVLGLPFSFSVCSADRFALGGVSLLQRIGASSLCFGIEPSGLPIYQAAAQLLEQPDDRFQRTLHRYLQAGAAYPRAQGLALAEALQIDPAILSQPNTALAISYARADLRLKANLRLLPVPRSGAYHDPTLSDRHLPSASAVRAAALNGDWAAVQQAMPAEAFALMRDAFARNACHLPEALTPQLRWTLRQGGDFFHLPGLSEGLENRLPPAADALTRDAMVQQIKSKRYPYARVNRLLTHALVGTDSAQLAPLPPHAWLLGFRRSASPLLRAMQQGNFSLLDKLKGTPSSYEAALDARAADLWALGAHQPFGAPWRMKPVIFP